jgi:DNA polymerase-1
MYFDYITDTAGMSRVVKEFALTQGDIGFDTETTGLDPYTSSLLLVQLRFGDKTYILDARAIGNKYLTYLIQLINDSGRMVIGHNLKFDEKFIRHNTGEYLKNIFDTMVAYYLIHNGLLKNNYISYKDLVQKYLNVTIEKEIRNEFIGYNKNYFSEELLLYSAIDVEHLQQLKEILVEKIKLTRQENVANLEMNVLPVFADMEYQGISFDSELWLDNEKQNKIELERIKNDLLDYYINNLDLSKFKSLLDIVKYLKITEDKSKRKTNTKKYGQELELIPVEFAKEWIRENINLESNVQNLIMVKEFGVEVDNTNEKTLLEYKQEKIVKLLLDYREMSKLISTYGANILEFINPVTKRIHPEINQIGTQSGRASSNNPNIQNQPRLARYRKPFTARPGYKLITADYSQAELRFIGSVSREKEFIDAYRLGQDLHKKTASILFKKPIEDITKQERYIGKTLNFGLNYQISEYGLFHNFGIPMDDGKKYIKEYFNGYKYINGFIKVANEKIIENMFSCTPFGRKRFFEDKVLFKEGNSERFRYYARIKREGVNHIIQGGVADAVKIAMKDIFNKNLFGEDLKILIQVHDELVVEVKENIVDDAVEFINKIMVESLQLFLKDIDAVVDIKVDNFWYKED